MRYHLVTKRHLTIQGREDRKEIMSRQRKDNTLKIGGKSFTFKKSDANLFGRLKGSIDGVGRVLLESGKIPDSERKRFLTSITESYLSIMLILHDILASSLDVKHHSVRRVVDASYTAEQGLPAVFVTAGAVARAQPWRAWEIMTQDNCLASCHTRLQKRLNGAIISALRKAACALEERKEGIENLGDYLTEIATFSLQVEENIHILLDNSDLLRLEEHQVSQLHQMLGRVKTLLEWKRPRPRD